MLPLSLELGLGVPLSGRVFFDPTVVRRPRFSPQPLAEGFGPTQNVTITTPTPGADIYYTLDGSTPDDTKTLYSTPIAIAATKTLKAIGIKSGLTNSPIKTGVYTINGAVSTPSFTPAAGTFSEAQSVQILCATSGASIYYTTDGSTPDATDTLYTGPIDISETTTIKAIGIKGGYSNSSVASGTFTINIDTGGFFTPEGDPMFTPADDLMFA